MKKNNLELIKDLKRWSQIAQHTFEKEDWDKCSLLHSFGDQLSRDINEAITIIEQLKIKHSINLINRILSWIGL